MSELLDDLARTLAQPMPRRRALGVLGVTLAGLATGGTAWGARGPSGARQSRGCGSAYKVCSPATEFCFAHCCPKHTVCSPGPVSSRGCQITPGCCDPCNREKSQPDGKGGCRPGPIPDHCPCKQGQKPCNAGRGRGVVCCDADEYCATSRKDEGSGQSVTGTCCKRGQTFCLGGPRGASGAPQRAFCCPRGTRCCVIAGVCCSVTKICARGGCRCKPGHTVRCGKHCCDPRRQKCCGGGADRRCVPLHMDCT
jgi:hypothetical protein